MTHKHNALTRIARVLNRAAYTVRFVRSRGYLVEQSYIIAAFYLCNIWINTNRYYLVLLVLFAGIMYRKTRNALESIWLLLLASIPFHQGKYIIESFQSFTYPSVFSSILYFITFSDGLLLALLYLLIRNRRMISSRVYTESADLVVLLLICTGAVSVYAARFYTISFFGYWLFIKMLLLYLASRILHSRFGWIRQTLEAFLLFVLFNSSLIIIQYLRGGPLGLPVERLNRWSAYGRYAFETATVYRPGGITDDPNASATVLGMFLPLLVLLGFTKHPLHKGFVWLTFAVSALALVFTGSRAVIITTAVTMTAVLIVLRHKNITVAIPSAVRRFMVPALAGITIYIVPLLYQRFATLTTALSSSGSGTFRLRHLQIALDTIKTNPFGSGLNTTAYEMSLKYPPEYYLFDTSELHSIFAQIIAGIGIPGFLLFLLFLYLTVKRLAKRVENQHNTILLAVLISLTSFLMAAGFYPWLLIISVSGFFWVLAGV